MLTLSRSRVVAGCVFLMLCVSAVAAAPATQPSADATAFMRFVEGNDGHSRLEAADVAYVNDANGVTVHLIGAVHVADPDFYAGLNESFRHYDALLYEMVKPKGADVPDRARAGQEPHGQTGGARRGASGSWIGMSQRFLQDRLKLAYQLDGIDYHARNFVHADLDWETFSRMQEQRGESFATLFFRSAVHSMAKAAEGKAPPGDVDGFALLGALASPDSARELKLMFARQFVESDDELMAMEGKQGSVLLAERNKAAFRVLRQQVAAGKKFIGIFYGAGHLKLMEQMLLDMGYRKADVVWRTAWDIPPAPTTGPATAPTP